MNRHDSKAHLETICDALEAYRADLIPEGDSQYDEIWSDICTAMAWIQEDLGVEEEVDDFVVSDEERSYGPRKA